MTETLGDYEIGTTYGGMVNVEELTVPVFPPKTLPRDASQALELSDGGRRGGGWAMTTWTWDGLEVAQRNQLKTFCPGFSAPIFIKTRKLDGTYEEYEAIMVWPIEEEPDRGASIDLTIEFRDLQVYTP